MKITRGRINLLQLMQLLTVTILVGENLTRRIALDSCAPSKTGLSNFVFPVPCVVRQTGLLLELKLGDDLGK